MKGIIIAVPEKYETIAFENIRILRNIFNNTLPIEIWQVGNEISEDYMNLFKIIPNITFKYVEHTNSTDENFWKGFQIKAYMLKHTQFDEVIL